MSSMPLSADGDRSVPFVPSRPEDHLERMGRPSRFLGLDPRCLVAVLVRLPRFGPRSGVIHLHRPVLDISRLQLDRLLAATCGESYTVRDKWALISFQILASNSDRSSCLDAVVRRAAMESALACGSMICRWTVPVFTGAVEADPEP